MRSPVVLTLLIGFLAIVPAPAAGRTAPPAEQRIVIRVTRDGFEPALVHARVGRPVRLVVTRTIERTCARDIVIRSLGIRKPLPLNRPVEVRFTPSRPGTIRYSCAMDMIAGSLVVE